MRIVILAGGEGRRIGGGKPERRVGGMRLLNQALDLWMNGRDQTL